MNKKPLFSLIALLVASTSAHAELVLEQPAPVQPAPIQQVVIQPAPVSSIQSSTWTPQGAREADPAKRLPSANIMNTLDVQASSQASSVSPSPAIRAASRSTDLPFVTQSGSPDGEVQGAGWAKGMPLSIALRQVVPPSFTVRENGVSLNSTVSWSGDRPWPVVLNEFAQQHKFVAHIDWNRGEVSLAPLTNTASRPAVRVAPEPRVFRTNEPEVVHAETRTTRVDRVETVQTHVDTSRYSKDTSATSERIITQTAVNNNVWVLDPKLTLRENIEAWAARVGWRVVWQGADYPIVAPATFTGEFAAPTGPVAKLISAYETSDQPLVATLTTMDRVIHVKNKYFERQEVVPSSPQEVAPELFNGAAP